MRPRQLQFALPTWGGKRQGAGRKPHGRKAGVPHEPRPAFPSRHPVHVTMRTLPAAGYLRGYRLLREIESALRPAKERFGLRIVHFSIQGNHLHLLVEADGPGALTRGIQGLAIRIARGINRSRSTYLVTSTVERCCSSEIRSSAWPAPS